MKAYLNLIKFALSSGYTVSVNDGEVWEVKRSTNYKKIKDCIESVEECTVRVRHHTELNGAGKHKILGNFLVLPYEEPEDTVADSTVGEFPDEWEKHYNNN